ncbi:hypothetical protein [Sphingomonas japonica]|uniref:SMODS-associating 2TM beta-strand rich effector domain-containing protein n=1 Tax=Sphingomonas japonica TaxID=511662 RepID=A0ABX0U721_9SPHN|nr:hypothetical protein [Sphingomonas japonica]NIJ24572.1 hypothetical protein [Sphingomonas japonica]
MPNDRDVSGVWYGSYSSTNRWVRPNRFIALLSEQGGAFAGTITEPDAEGITDILRADVTGTRSGATVHFTKRYDGASWTRNIVQYSGRIDDAGTEITGEWSFSHYSGGFVMTRENFATEQLEDEASDLMPFDS